MTAWTPSRAAAQAALAAFLPRAGGHYTKQRNYDLGPNDRTNVSCLSPYLRRRLITEEEVVAKVLSRFAASTAEKFIQEVFWRTYFKGWLEQRPQVWHQYRNDIVQLRRELECDSALRRRYDSAIGGRTGIDCFDAWAVELIEDGYLHNHARMWFASIWIFTLGLPWQLGAQFFLDHLLDGDPASNTLSWRWVAGLHTKGKNYAARIGNIRTYTEGRFEVTGRLASQPAPLTEPYDFPKGPLPRIEAPCAGTAFGLLITEEDCAPESLPLPGAPAAVLGLTAPGWPGQAERVVAFSAAAVEDATERAAEFFSVTGSVPGSLSGRREAPGEWAGALAAWAKTAGLSRILTAYAPAGPVAARLEAAKAPLAERGIALSFVQRAYDRAAWPSTGKGFFGLKKQIPSLLDELGLA